MSCGPFVVLWDARCVLKGSAPNGHSLGFPLMVDAVLLDGTLCCLTYVGYSTEVFFE